MAYSIPTTIPSGSGSNVKNASGKLHLTQPVEHYRRLAREVLVPPQAQDVWRWCSDHLVMEDGRRWSTERALIMRRWLRLVQARLSGRPDPRDPYAHLCEQLWICAATQIVKTTFLHDVLLYTLANFPRKAALYMGRGADLKDNRIFRLQARLERIKALERRLPRGDEARERALGTRTWSIGTGLQFFLNGNVIDDLRSGNYGLIAADELERFDLDVGGYGDPIDQMASRQRTYPRSRLLIGASSPGVLSGHMWRRLTVGASDERLMITCSTCAASDWLNPTNIVLSGDHRWNEVSPAAVRQQRLARYVCTFCGVLHDGEALRTMSRDAVHQERWSAGTWSVSPEYPDGHWVPHADRDGNGRLTQIYPVEGFVRSAQMGSLFSIDQTLDEFASGWAKASQGTEGNRKTFINNERAECWLRTVTEADTDKIKATTTPTEAYQFGHGLPHAAPYLLLIFDQQGNSRDTWWFPWVLRAFAPGGESWLVDAGRANTIEERDALEQRSWMIGGVPKKPTKTAMDCGNGNYLFEAYLWASKRPADRVLVRGDPRAKDGIPWAEVVDKPGTKRRTPKPPNVREWKVHPHYWRTELWDAIRALPSSSVDRPRPRWWLADGTPDFYLNSLTSEEQVVERRRVPGGWAQQVVWRPRVINSTGDSISERTDNHWWDNEANALALAHILGWCKDRPKPSTVTNRVRRDEPNFMAGFT